MRSDYHEPYVKTATGQIFCFKDGCDWTADGGSEEANVSWDKHLEDDKQP